MEISGKILREVEFRDRLRGYDTDEVDEFLEKVAVAVDELRAQLEAAPAAGATRPSGGAPEPRPDGYDRPDDDALRRTLVLAQRTADLAISEAREEADRILAEARAQSEAVVAQAEEAARRLRADAEEDLHARVARLSEQRDRLERDVQALARLVEGERERLAAGLGAALRFLEEHVALSDEASAAASASLGARPVPVEPAPSPAFEVGRDVEAEIDEDAQLARGARDADASADPDEALWARWTQGVDLGVVPDPGDLPAANEQFWADRRERGGYSA